VSVKPLQLGNSVSADSRVRGGAQDPNPPTGVLDDGQDVHPGTGQRHRLKEVGSEDSFGLRA
jgi:hypothetical protein